jgi:hypothetical protein
VAGADTVLPSAIDSRARAPVAPAALMNSNDMSAALLPEANRHGICRFASMSNCARYRASLRTPEAGLFAPINVNDICKLLKPKYGGRILHSQLHWTAGTSHFQCPWRHRQAFFISSRLEQAIWRGKPIALNNMGRMQRDPGHVPSRCGCLYATSASAHVQPPQHRYRRGDQDIGALRLGDASGPAAVPRAGHATREAEYPRADMGKLNEFRSHDLVKTDDVRQRFRLHVVRKDIPVPLR